MTSCRLSTETIATNKALDRSARSTRSDMETFSARTRSMRAFADYSMTLFCPTVDRMPTPVLTVCPACGRSDTTDQLTNQEKQFLLDATSYHELFTELGFLKAVDRILRAYPGT